MALLAWWKTGQCLFGGVPGVVGGDGGVGYQSQAGMFNSRHISLCEMAIGLPSNGLSLGRHMSITIQRMLKSL